MNPFTSVVQIIARTVRRAGHLFQKDGREREMDEEMRAHIAFEAAERVRQGMTVEDARRAALVIFGGVERFKEESRDARGVRPVEDLVQDAGYAMRVLRKTPGFTIAAISTIALGVAATTAVFSAVNAILFRPPPVAEPSRLFTVVETWKSGQHSYSTDMANYMYRFAHYRELRGVTASVFDGIAAYRYGTVALRTQSEARSLSSLSVSSNYFTVLGIGPALGSFFSDTVEHSGPPASEAVISHDLWQREFLGDTHVIGRSMFVDSRKVTVVGVAPAGFVGTTVGLAADIWIPTNSGKVTMFARLKPGYNVPQASAALTSLTRPLPLDDPDPLHKVVRVTLDAMIGPPAMTRTPVIGFLGMLMVTATLVLLIVAANIAGMFLARAAHRRREIAVRLALGASRGRLIRQLLTESLVLALVGGVGGVILAHWLVSALPALQLPVGVRTVVDFHVDGRVLLVSLAITLCAGLISGLAPALQATRVDLLSALRGAGAAQPRRLGVSRSAFVVLQLSFALVLLVTSGLFTRALNRAVATDPGLDARNIDVAEIDVSPHGYDAERGPALLAALSKQLRARPEVASIALAQWTPLAMGSNSEEVRLPNGARELTGWGVADNEYLQTLSIPILEGRNFNESDTPTSAPVAIVNETLARKLSPGASAVGRTFNLNGVHEIIGVTRDGKYRSLDESATSFAFFPLAQRYTPRVVLYYRAKGGRVAALNAVRGEVAALNPNIALERVGSLSGQLSLYYLPQQFAAWCIGAFGVMGLGLALVGIYGTMAYYALQRTHEFGIRIALGARWSDITGAVLRPGAKVILMAICVGIPIAIVIGQIAKGFLYGVGAVDPVTYVGVIVLLSSVAMVASYVPARRAARVDPMISLRGD